MSSSKRNPHGYAEHMAAIRWLGNEPRSASVLATAQRLLQAQQDMRQLLPGAMGQACHVALIEQGRMTITVPSAAHAAKLRQMGPALCRDLARKGWAIDAIQVRIAMRTMPSARDIPAPRQTVPLGQEGLQAFSSLASSLRPGPLADAVQRLLSHHR